MFITSHVFIFGKKITTHFKYEPPIPRYVLTLFPCAHALPIKTFAICAAQVEIFT